MQVLPMTLEEVAAANAADSSEDEDSDNDGVAPLAGFGCGLPLSRTGHSRTHGFLSIHPKI